MHKISFSSIYLVSIKYLIFAIKVNDLPEPAPAIIKQLSSSLITQFNCSLSNLYPLILSNNFLLRLYSLFIYILLLSLI